MKDQYPWYVMEYQSPQTKTHSPEETTGTDQS